MADPILRDREFSLDSNSKLIDTLTRIEINPSELCNRACAFCPRSNPEVYSNRNLHMLETTAESIAKNLHDINYSNRVTISGFGEPLLSRNIFKIIEIISLGAPNIERLQLITNGDQLNEDVIVKLYSAGITRLEINLYDSEQQVEYFKRILQNIDDSLYVLRHHYYSSSKDYGLTLNNRAGSIDVGSKGNFSDKICYLPFYKLMIDWNGNILLCCQDWKRVAKLKLNINTHSITEIWDSVQMNEYRDSLIERGRVKSPCSECNIDGTLIGRDSFNIYKNVS